MRKGAPHQQAAAEIRRAVQEQIPDAEATCFGRLDRGLDAVQGQVPDQELAVRAEIEVETGGLHGDHVHFGSPHRPPVEFQLVTDEITSRFTTGTMQALPEDAKTRGVVSGRSMNLLGQALKAMVEGRVLEEVLAIVVDQAVALSSAERGFVMLAPEGAGSQGMVIRMARDRRCDMPEFGTKIVLDIMTQEVVYL